MTATTKRSPVRHPAVAFLVIAVGLVVTLILHLGLGSVRIPPLQVVDALLGHPAQEYQRIIVWNLRLPRGLIALTAGGMLGIAGALAQRLTRNPLADPGLIGVSAGSILGIVVCLTAFPDAVAHQVILPFAGMVGAVLSIAVVYVLTRRLSDDPFRFALKGIILSAVLGSVSSLLLIRDNQALPTVLLWMIGSLNAKVWQDWNSLWPWAAVTVPAGLLCARAANALRFEDGVATGLGYRVTAARLALFFAAATLTAGAVSVVGDIWFIGLIGPHIARRLVGHDARRLLPMSALASALLLLLADLVIGLLPGSLSTVPDGAVTAMLGAPFFLYLIVRARR